MRTISEALDMLLQGRSAEMGDVLMQRFKAIETAAKDDSWGVASRLELIPPAGASAVDHEERELAVGLEMRERKLEALTRRTRGFG